MAQAPELTQAIKDRVPLASLLTLSPPSGDLLISDRPTISESLGAFQAKGTFGKLNRKLSGPNGDLDAPSVQVTIAETGTEEIPVGEIGRILRRLEKVPAVIKRGAEGVDPSKWSTRFTGILQSWDPGSKRGEYVLVLRVDDEWLNRPFPPILDRATWPTASTTGQGSSAGSETVLGQRGPACYGNCSSSGLGSHGLRRLPFVQTAGPPWRWLWSIGDAPVTTVFVDGVATATGWTRVVELRGGYLWTTIDFDPRPGSDPAADPVITADGGGINVTAFGLQTSPAAQLRHLLEAFGKGWNGKDAVTATLTDGTVWTALEAFVVKHGYESGAMLGGKGARTVRDVLREVLKAYAWHAYWARGGKLAVKPWDWSKGDVTPGSSIWIVEEENAIVPLQLQAKAGSLQPGFRVRYCGGPDGEPLLSTTALDPTALDKEPDEVVLALGPQRVL